MKLWQKIVCWTALVVLCIYAIVICTVPRMPFLTQPCPQINISVSDSALRHYVTSPEILTHLTKSKMAIKGSAYNTINCYKVEDYIKTHPMVENAECYLTTDAQVFIEVTQRQPVLRVAGDGNYFVDTHREIMPLKATTATYVPVVTGRVTKRMATEELFDFAEWLQKNRFWEAQIEQIYVNERQEIELVPRVGSGVILLGKLDDKYPARLKKLKKLYTDGFSETGWKNYSEIDLRYDGQVVCR